MTVLHIPRDARKPDCSLGYAFINLHDAAVASQVVRAAKGLAWSSFSNSEKVCDVELAHVQGVERLKRRFAQRTRDAVHAPHLINEKGVALLTSTGVQFSTEATYQYH